jgi:hypothetical protein
MVSTLVALMVSKEVARMVSTEVALMVITEVALLVNIVVLTLVITAIALIYAVVALITSSWVQYDKCSAGITKKTIKESVESGTYSNFGEYAVLIMWRVKL